MRNEKMAIVCAVVLALTRARAAFADADDDFLKYLKANDMQKLEKLVNSKAKNMNLDSAMGWFFIIRVSIKPMRYGLFSFWSETAQTSTELSIFYNTAR
jgi:hypothetical protein